MKLPVYCFFVLPPLWLSPTIALSEQPFEIRFAPDKLVYRLPANEDQRLYDCVLHNFAVTNKTPRVLTLDRIEVQLLRSGELVQSNLITSDELETKAQKTSMAHTTGALKEAEKEFRIGELFGNVKISASRRLNSNSGVLIHNVYLSWTGKADKVRVLAEGQSEDGKKIHSSADLTIGDYEQKNQFRLPLSGNWIVTTAANPSGEHRWGIGQEFACDLERVDGEGKVYHGNASLPQNYYAYGQKVIAPAQGVVVEVRDQIDDTRMSELHDADPAIMAKRLREFQTKLRDKYGPRGADGNYVMIDHGQHEYSVMVHLKKGSLRVKPGDSVQQGQEIGEVGQSGLSTQPHLHFEVVTDPNPLKQRGLPIAFVGLEGERDAKFLSVGDLITRE